MLVHSHEEAENSRIEALRRKHETLSCEIENERKKLSFSDLDMACLKKQKLQIKEEIFKILQCQEEKSVAS